MAMLKLNEKSVAGLPPATSSAQTYHWDTVDRGFGVVVGRTGQKTFVVRGRSAGKQVKRSIGVAGQPRESDGRPWTVQLAKLEADKIVGTWAQGKPVATKQARASNGPTLRQALEYHVSKMERGENRRGKICSPRSVATLRGGIELHLRDYLDRPIVEITADVLEDVRDRIEGGTSRRADANPKNPAGRALGNRILANVSAIWRSWHRRHGLPVACPVERLQLRALKPRGTRVDNADLPAWYATVMAMENPVRRDLQLAAMFSGVRAEGIRTLRHEDIDRANGLIHIARAKGDRPYAVPLTATLLEIVDRRAADNRLLMASHGGDDGWVFPSVSRDGKTVQCVAEPKERRVVRDARGKAKRDDEGGLVREKHLPGIQVSRATYNSIAMEVGVPQEIRERLLNHAGRGVNVKHYGMVRDWAVARDAAVKVEAAIWERIGVGVTRSR